MFVVSAGEWRRGQVIHCTSEAKGEGVEGGQMCQCSSLRVVLEGCTGGVM